MSDATGVAEGMLGLPGFRVLKVEETDAEVMIRIETSAGLVGCPRCGVVAMRQAGFDGDSVRPGPPHSGSASPRA